MDTNIRTGLNRNGIEKRQLSNIKRTIEIDSPGQSYAVKNKLRTSWLFEVG